MILAQHPRPLFPAKPLRSRRLRVRSSLNPLECAVLSKHRVLPCFSRNRAPTSTLECALARALIHKSFRMRSSEKSGGMGYSRLFLSPNSFPCHTSENSPVSPIIATDPRPPRGYRSLWCSGYLLMSSFASRRLSRGWRNGFVASGAPLMACVISFAAVGKSPVFDEIRASARWLIQ